MWTALFWKAAVERAVKTAAQALILLWGADAGFNVLDVQVGTAFGLAAGAAVLSLLTSVASAGLGEKGTPSLVTELSAALPAVPPQRADGPDYPHRL